MSEKRKTERLAIRLTSEEKSKLAYNAKLMSVSISEYILLCLKRRRIVICEDFPKLIFHLSKIGNNINQIAAVANANQNIPKESIDEVMNLMTLCYGKLTEFIDFITEPERGLETATDKTPEMLSAIFEMIEAIESKLNSQKRE